MLVAVAGLGSIWRRRYRKADGDTTRFARGAYYNTTGVNVGGQVRQRPRIIGYARFNATGGVDVNFPLRIIGRVFECAPPCIHQGNNKVLFKRLLPHGEPPDFFLVVVRPERIGLLKVGAANWRSNDTWLLSFSENGAQQEAMLLMPAHSWIRSVIGTFVLEPAARPWLAKLRMRDCTGVW